LINRRGLKWIETNPPENTMPVKFLTALTLSGLLALNAMAAEGVQSKGVKPSAPQPPAAASTSPSTECARDNLPKGSSSQLARCKINGGPNNGQTILLTASKQEIRAKAEKMKLNLVTVKATDEAHVFSDLKAERSGDVITIKDQIEFEPGSGVQKPVKADLTLQLDLSKPNQKIRAEYNIAGKTMAESLDCAMSANQR
jgi:flagellar basal body L-ring protein FlgH